MAIPYNYNQNANLGNTQKILVEEVMYNVSVGAFGKEVEKFFTLSNKGDDSYLFGDYHENYLPVKVFYKTKRTDIGYERLMQENEKGWKEFWERLHSLWKRGKLEFGSKEAKTAFFKECKLLGIK